MIAEILQEWRAVRGYEGVYEVSNLGNVRSLTRQILRGGVWRTIQGQDKRARVSKSLGSQVMLTQHDERESVMVSHLVWEAFRGAIPDGMVIVHRDKDPTNNRLDNLELLTRADAGRTAKRTKCRRASQRQIPGEIWKDIEEAWGVFQISSHKRVRSKPQTLASVGEIGRKIGYRILLPRESNGRLQVRMQHNGQTVQLSVDKLWEKYFGDN